ncbi:MAG: hypothetical protein KAY24_18960 [Candidatus Eisenbacteria sp.]|nr:hypothetical protein [Candidatus Eisenbacteria bacterium]
MSNRLKPWARSAFELIVHAETHLRDGGDFDRRIAHIGFDNAIEVAITTYLSLNPIQRGGKTYKRDDVEEWLRNYHTKLKFLAEEAKTRGCTLRVPNDEIIFYHNIRNSQYHAGGPGVPESEHLAALRTATLDVFSLLFDVANVEQVLEQRLLQQITPQEEQPSRNETVDKLLDMVDEPIFIAGQPYAVSEALYATDPEAYQAVVAAVIESRNIRDELLERYPSFLHPDIVHISFVHYEDVVYLKVVDRDISLTNTEFIAGDEFEDHFFSISKSPDYNADLLVSKFDPFSIINCFDLFSEQAASEIDELHRAGRLESLFPSTYDVGEGTT